MTSPSPEPLIPDDPDPYALFGAWMAEADKTEPNDANAMSLATATPSGAPSVRIVLLKGWSPEGFVFYTNYESQKGTEALANPQGALCFHWKSLGRQVRAQGALIPVSEADADAYFASRPRDSQLGAWASDQSRPLAFRQDLVDRFTDVSTRFETAADVPRPPHWSGFRLEPTTVEFWQAVANRLHDRVVYHLTDGAWSSGRVFP